MKYVLSLFTGLLLGASCALAIVYFNPLTRSQSDHDGSSDWTLDYALAPERTWLSTHDRRLELPVVPQTVPLLYEQGIRGTILTAMPLAAGADTIAAATRISIPSADTEFLRSGLLVEDVWLISVPGNGSLFVRALNNQWPLFRDTVVRVDWLGREFSGPGSYDPTRGPADGGADVVGLTGSYAGAHGHGRERFSLSSYDGSLSTITGQLMIEMADAGR